MAFAHDSKIKRMRVFERMQPAIDAIRAEISKAEIHAARQNKHHKREAPEWKVVDALRAEEKRLMDVRERAVSHWSFNRTI